ncbi:uncharacterized protein EAF01_003612 [Botrytis porri]|uniref:uncharacterized protein n=1 Tax=Botrytis porri TaxID=87229 RepID=UPI0019021143|nr:uncharacterized protein EAF01_003612 [Botrytis porri]KAF7909894.1 hypothetical protein EAF01_003612 [Botrytis porri]
MDDSPSHPLILLLHGFPELSFSYRHILPSLSSLGHHVVAPDQRGAGRTTGHDTRSFSAVDLHTTTISRLVTDMVLLVHALGHKDVACVIGHDFGAVIAGWCGVMRPDLFKSSPPPSNTTEPTSPPRKPPPTSPPSSAAYFYLKSGHWSGNTPHPLPSFSATELQHLPPYYIMPLHSSMREVIQTHMRPIPPSSLTQLETWLPDSDLAVYASEYART